MDDKKENNFKLIVIQKKTYNMMLQIKNNHGFGKMSNNDVILFLLMANSRRLRLEMVKNWIEDGDKHDADELVEKINGYY